MIKRVTVFMLILSLFFTGMPIGVSAVKEQEETAVKTPSLSAVSAALFCVNNGTFVVQKESQKKMSMASTTKILTSLMALEAANAQNAAVTITDKMYAEGSSMYLKAGYQLTLSDLAAGMMSVSGNDAANAVALTLADSFADFAKLMNSKAKQIGMENSNFITPSGLDDENHYSTAEDMAFLMDYAMGNESFAEIAGKKTVKVDFIKPEGTSITYGNHNRLLSLYQYCNGGKTGFTKKSGRCLVSSAEKDGIKLIAVTLSAPDDWNDHIKMYKYGFDQLTTLPKEETKIDTQLLVVGGKQDAVQTMGLCETPVVVEKERQGQVVKKIIAPKFVYAPVEKGQVLGKVVYMVNGKEIASSPLTAKSRCDYKEIDKSFLDKAGDFFLRMFTGS